MKLKEFRVKRFRSVVDSGWVRVDPQVTCLAGKNEAGKSALLEALYLLNPVYADAFDANEHYPVWLKVPDRKKGDLGVQTPIGFGSSWTQGTSKQSRIVLVRRRSCAKRLRSLGRMPVAGSGRFP